jgi:SAM-dependent methyltransferase
MGALIIGLHDWYQTPAGRYMLDWERQQVGRVVADIFGYHALQLGAPELDALQANRMPHQWLACDHIDPSPQPASLACRQLALVTDYAALPFPASSLDLVVLPHTLERSADPHACLREVERVLIPEGQVLITGLNPMSLWGRRPLRGSMRLAGGAPVQSLIAYRRLRDWLRLLGFEVQVSRFGGWSPALGSERWMQRLGWMERAGERWWPILGGVYLLMATKRVPGGRLLPARPWRTVRSPAAATVPVARSDTFMAHPPAEKDAFDPR